MIIENLSREENTKVEFNPLSKKEIEEGKKHRVKEREKWFKIEPIYMLVFEEDFIKFIKTYPRKLDCDVYGISNPSLITYNDFELANCWPYSIVAKTWDYSDDPKNYFYKPPQDRSYYVLVNYEEVFNSKTEYKE